MIQPLLLANLSRSEQFHQLAGGFGQVVIDRVADGWSPYLLVLKFRHLSHCRQRTSIIAEMHDAAEGAYTRLLFRIWKHPRANSVRSLRPVWVLIADVPGSGSRQLPIRDLLPNDGLHLQGVVAMPPGSRLREPLDEHLAQAGDRYCPRGGPLVALHATPITSDVAYVNSYNFKSLRRGRAELDDVLILPRPVSDLESRPCPATDPWRTLVRAVQ
ncbi:hypothetical protein [Methylorubrum salsuginis]|uniref:Uncharacterized protein n=1 Tax=Methylorubrum salsuginis TaxID=414703 RepID=A0A1I4MYU0_9HYPH|nr:hypothetical protein [Methylorubrum salsuginis]SFM08431.1 hypothetical protein SAMN04488125_1492 [Methylorubrum salsuginis]